MMCIRTIEPGRAYADDRVGIVINRRRQIPTSHMIIR